MVGDGDIPASLESASGPMAGICLRREHPMVLWKGRRGADCEQTGFLSGDRRAGREANCGRVHAAPPHTTLLGSCVAACAWTPTRVRIDRFPENPDRGGANGNVDRSG